MYKNTSFVLCAALFCLPPAYPQNSSEFVGTVTDSSGAPVPGAKVTVIEIDRHGIGALRSFARANPSCGTFLAPVANDGLVTLQSGGPLTITEGADRSQTNLFDRAVYSGVAPCAPGALRGLSESAGVCAAAISGFGDNPERQRGDGFD